MYARGIGHCGAGCPCDGCRGMGQSDWIGAATSLLTSSFQVGTFMIPVWAAAIAGVGLLYALSSGGDVRRRR